jgi:antitoxin ParD1/3/4/toxin ParE1/3/4
MKSFVLTFQAEKDISEIWEYIAQDNVDMADRVIGELEGSIRKLAGMPNMGHVREDLADTRHRFWPVRSYPIVYRPDTTPLQVIRVISGYRDVADLLA